MAASGSQQIALDLDQYDLSEEDVSKMIADIVQYLIVVDQAKSVIKRADIMRVCGLSKKPRKVQDYALITASTTLSDVFGIQVFFLMLFSFLSFTS